MADDTPSRGRRRWPWKRILLALIVVPVLGLAGLFVLTRSEPAHYQEFRTFLETTTPEQRAEIAESVLDRFEQKLRQATGRRPSGSESDELDLDGLAALLDEKDASDAITGRVTTDRRGNRHMDVRVRMTVTQQELQALIAQNAETWVRQQGYTMPSEVQDPTVSYSDGKWIAACTLSVGDYTQVVSGYFNVNFEPGGMAKGSLTGFDAGRLPVPLTEIGSFVADKLGSPERGRQVEEAVAKLKAFEVKPTLQIDGKRVTLEDVKPGAGGFDVQARVRAVLSDGGQVAQR